MVAEDGAGEPIATPMQKGAAGPHDNCYYYHYSPDCITFTTPNILYSPLNSLFLIPLENFAGPCCRPVGEGNSALRDPQLLREPTTALVPIAVTGSQPTQQDLPPRSRQEGKPFRNNNNKRSDSPAIGASISPRQRGGPMCMYGAADSSNCCTASRDESSVLSQLVLNTTMPDLACVAQQTLGFVWSNPLELKGDSELLLLHLQVSARRYAIVVVSSLCLSPVVFRVVRSLPLSKQQGVQEFLDAENSSEAVQPVRVCGDQEEAAPENGKKRWRLQLHSGEAVVASLYREVRALLESGTRCVCHLSGRLGGAGSRQDLPKRVVRRFVNDAVRRATEGLLTQCAVQLCFFGLCKLLDAGLHQAERFPRTAPYARLMSGDAAAPLRAFQLADFSASAWGFLTRAAGRRVCRVLAAGSWILYPETNFFWLDAAAADAVWASLTPSGFFVVTTMSVARPLMRKGCHECLRFVSGAARRRLDPEREHRDRRGGTITVVRQAKSRSFLALARPYLVNFNLIGAPALAFVASTFAWSKDRQLLFQHNGGPRYEAVGSSLLLWWVSAMCLDIPKLTPVMAPLNSSSPSLHTGFGCIFYPAHTRTPATNHWVSESSPPPPLPSFFFLFSLSPDHPNLTIFMLPSAAQTRGGHFHHDAQEKLRLYRSLLKGAYAFPLRSRRDVVTEEVRSAFRDPHAASLSKESIDYRLVLGWQRAETIKTYAQNMYWFHSRDEVTKEMLHYSQARDEERAKEAERCNRVGPAPEKTPEVLEFKSTYYNVHPDYFHKIGEKPLTHSRDLWRARGQYGSDVGGPRQKFFVRRFKAMFPQGW
eukprot:gene4242-3066_t